MLRGCFNGSESFLRDQEAERLPVFLVEEIAGKARPHQETYLTRQNVVVSLGYRTEHLPNGELQVRDDAIIYVSSNHHHAEEHQRLARDLEGILHKVVEQYPIT